MMHDLRYYEIILKIRRPEPALFSDIIDAIQEHGTKSLTKIQNTANLEYERMQRLMRKMQKLGFLDESFNITEKGKNFRKDFEPLRKMVAQVFAKYWIQK